MNEPILVALIGTTGVIVGAALTFLASYFTSKQKNKEIEIGYRQKLHENYLAIARLHIETLYMPIYENLTKLYKSYPLSTDDKTIQNFRQTCTECITQISDLLDKTEGIYLATEIEERLQFFIHFLRNSLDTDELRYIRKIPNPRRKNVYEAVTVLLNDLQGSKLSKNINVQIIFDVYFEIGDLELLYSAPVTSVQFAGQFIESIQKLRSLIRDIVLGQPFRTDSKNDPHLFLKLKDSETLVRESLVKLARKSRENPHH